MRLVHRVRDQGIWRGDRRDPRNRAGAMIGRVSEYIYKENGRDWAKVALRLEEAVKVLPYAVPAFLELGNAYLRLGERDKARAAYKKILEQKQMPVDALFAKQIQAQIDRLASDEPLTKMEPIRNPWRE